LMYVMTWGEFEKKGFYKVRDLTPASSSPPR
jgi:hypothetical protein